MLLILDSYRSLAPLGMTTKLKRVILNEVKNLYISTANNISMGNTMVLYYSSSKSG